MRKHNPVFLSCLALCFIFATYQTIDARTSQIVYLRPDDVIRTGTASWYSCQSPGIKPRTANNEVFDDNELTAAMWGVPFDQLIRVTNLQNGRSVTVRVNDRGPHERFVREGRIIDLSKQACMSIAVLDQGIIPIRLELL